MSYQAINPATGETGARFESWNDTKTFAQVEKAQQAFESWRQVDFSERAKLMKKAAGLLRERKERYGRLITQEMGKPLTAAIAEVEKCAMVCDFYADNTTALLVEEIIQTEAAESYVRFDPLGVVLAVMPWNFPLWQVYRFAAPALMAGNAGILKHASNVPESALSIEEVFAEAGFPEGLFQTFLIEIPLIEPLIRDRRVKAATLTGSEYAGSQVAMQSGREIKPTVLELGGSDPFIVLADADLEEASSWAVKARFQNSGQSCIAAKRFILLESIADDFIDRFKEKTEKLVMGDPLDTGTDMGPISTAKLRDQIHSQVEKSVAMGAQLVTGGVKPEGLGYFYPPTILTYVKPGMPAYEEEIFGPVASVMVVPDEETAIKVANDTEFGLGSSIWTRDTAKAKALAPRIEAGCVFINAMVKSDPRLPFGGVKKSGYGRELSSYGIKEFVNIKTVWVEG